MSTNNILELFTDPYRGLMKDERFQKRAEKYADKMANHIKKTIVKKMKKKDNEKRIEYKFNQSFYCDSSSYYAYICAERYLPMSLEFLVHQKHSVEIFHLVHSNFGQQVVTYIITIYFDNKGVFMNANY